LGWVEGGLGVVEHRFLSVIPFEVLVLELREASDHDGQDMLRQLEMKMEIGDFAIPQFLLQSDYLPLAFAGFVVQLHYC
jgi:hypothetical protein